MKKLISVITPTYNEELNIEKLIFAVEKIMDTYISQYDYEHIVIDNKSTDQTIDILKRIAKNKKNLRVIINSRNFGHIRSPFYGLLQTKGDASIFLNADFQDPPEMIPDFIKSWESGYRITLAQKTKTNDSFIMKCLKSLFYKTLNAISKIDLPLYVTGSGIYDKKIIELFRKIKDPYPYLRGLVAELEEDINLIEFEQPKRLRGKSSNNFFTLYDYVILGLVKHSSAPLRFAIFLGFISSFLSFISGIVYFSYKLTHWLSFDIGIGPLVIGMFFFFSLTIFLIGLIGEYILSILTYSQNLPLVVEKERINFE